MPSATPSSTGPTPSAPCGFCAQPADQACVRCGIGLCPSHARSEQARCADCETEYLSQRSGRWLTKLFVVPPFALFATFVGGFLVGALAGVSAGLLTGVVVGSAAGVVTNRWIDREARREFLRERRPRLPAATARLRLRS